MNLIKSLLIFSLLVASLFPIMGWAQPAVSIYSTGGYTFYHLRLATVARNEARYLISAAYDGKQEILLFGSLGEHCKIYAYDRAVNGILRGNKGQTFEGGIRIRSIAWWPGKINPGSTCNYPASVFDFYSTITALVNHEGVHCNS